MRNIAKAKAQADSKGVMTGKQWSEDRQTVRNGTGRLSGVGTNRQSVSGGEER
jgi:hypothetical protein